MEFHETALFTFYELCIELHTLTFDSPLSMEKYLCFDETAWQCCNFDPHQFSSLFNRYSCPHLPFTRSQLETQQTTSEQNR
jgi:hypothetical protein